MDVLSDVLRVVRLSGAIFFAGEFTAPWALESPPPKVLAPVILPRAECFTIFHVLAEGTCWVKAKGDRPIQMPPTGTNGLTTDTFDIHATRPGQIVVIEVRAGYLTLSATGETLYLTWY